MTSPTKGVTKGGSSSGGGFFQHLLKKTMPRAAAPVTSSAVSSLKSDPVSLLLDNDFEPTEEDMTETEHPSSHDNYLYSSDGGLWQQSSPVSGVIKALQQEEDEENNYDSDDDDDDDDDVDDDQAVVLSPQEMHAALASILKKTMNEIDESGFTQNQENRTELLKQQQRQDAQDDGLFTMEMLVDLLNQANRPDHYSRRRRLKQPNPDLEVQDLTKILSHVNICEDAGAMPRWDVIYELAYGNHYPNNNNSPKPRRRAKKKAPQQEEQEEEVDGMIVMDARSSGSSRVAKLSQQDEENVENEMQFPPRRLPLRTASSDTQSLSLGDVMGAPPDENESAFTLEANTHSVDSSVTWFEGANITEIEISEDELDEFPPNYGHDNDNDNDDDHSRSGGDSTPPPPSGVDILYSPPPLDFASLDDDQDSLERCYRRRHPRRYAPTE